MSLIPGLFKSPLRYPGGKGKIANFIKLLMLDNGLVGRDYVEPYAGGASVALDLLFEDFADTVHINDLNPGVYAFWDAVINHTDEFCRRIETTPITMDEWYRQKAIAEASGSSHADLAYATFFLNRTNRSGIISGGVIGGKGQNGEWKLDARFNSAELVARIRKIGRHRTRIQLTNLDAVEFLQRWTVAGEVSAFLYLDPPYFVKGEGLYDNFYGPEDHSAVASTVRKLVHPWIVSYDAAPEIVRLYAGLDSIRYSMTYSANERGLGSEVMFFSPGFEQPAQSPAKVASEDVRKALAATLTRG